MFFRLRLPDDSASPLSSLVVVVNSDDECAL